METAVDNIRNATKCDAYFWQRKPQAMKRQTNKSLNRLQQTFKVKL